MVGSTTARHSTSRNTYGPRARSSIPRVSTRICSIGVSLGLATLSDALLSRSIQVGEHSPVEDADAMRELYLLKFPYDHEAEVAKVKAQRPTHRPGQKGKGLAKLEGVTAAPQTKRTADSNFQKSQKKAENRSGSAKRRERKKAAAEVEVKQGGQVKLAVHAKGK